MEKSRYLYHQLDVVVQENLREKLQNTLNNNFIVIIRHAKTRANERKVNKSDLIKFLKKGEYRIVELNIKDGNARCLIRTKEVDSYEIVASVCIKTGAVITCWTNHIKDNHHTLDMNLYGDVNEQVLAF